MASARSLPESAQLQTAFVEQFMTRTADQTKAFFALSAHATQQFVDTAHAASKSIATSR